MRCEIDQFSKIYEPGDASSQWQQHTVDLSGYISVADVTAFVNMLKAMP